MFSNNNMFPSERKRNFYLKWGANTKIVKIAFSAIGILLLIAGITFFIINAIDPFYGTAYVNGVPREINQSLFLGIIFTSIGAIYSIIGFVVTSLIEKFIHKGEIAYPIRNINYPIYQLMEDAKYIDDKYLVTINGNWIDVSYNWMNSNYFQGLGMASTNSVYTKMYRINPDQTFSELDLISESNKSANLSGLSFNKSFKCGRFYNRTFNMRFGIDQSGIGPHVYSLNTMEITNYMHKWFADRGYREKK